MEQKEDGQSKILGLGDVSQEELNKIGVDGSDDREEQQGRMILAPVEFFYQETIDPNGVSGKRLLCFSPAAERFYVIAQDLIPLEMSEEESHQLMRSLQEAYEQQMRRAALQSGMGQGVPSDIASSIMQR